ncbi:NADH dehydrogenase 32K chain-like protein [Halococcus morrhuae DSM 1307]|uniref:NADH dehydrogenase 32K chain-like protein n=1 Tax=Halococcus morrhuae DSM 1307 TaxID=931277 RepID=M0M3X5_HALMO|nr:NAD(P)H-binding protein [Halococcus morrhuae]EMA40108.1 NADH dehydrogenase 32K chain-like protein [Halococcus morrhuae DSM 1307]
MRVLVTGATGFVGGRLLPALAAAGHDLTVLTRDAERYDGPPARVVEGDLLDAGSFEAAFEGCEAAYYLVHSMDAADFVARDRRAAHNFARAADAADCSRVIYLGGLGRDSDALSPHLRSRHEVERLLAAGDYDLTVLRAAVIVGAGGASFEMVRRFVAHLPRVFVLPLPTAARTNCQPIAIDDVVGYLAAVLDAPETRGRSFDIGGPAVLSYADLLRRMARAYGHRLFVAAVPWLSERLAAHWLALFTGIPETVVAPLMAGLDNTVVVRNGGIDELVSVAHTPLDAAIERAIAGD